MNLANIAILKSLLAKYDKRMAKSLGQNFLTNPDVCPKMADFAAEFSSSALEIGPGIGVLTQELAKKCEKVVTIELDSKLLPILDETLADFANVEIIFGDVLKLNLENIIAEKFDKRPVVCANLPYYITTPIITKMLTLPIKALIIMVQKEVATRLLAPLGDKNCGAISGFIEYYADVAKLFDVKRGSFYPAPNVDSSVICLTLRDNPPVDVDEQNFFKVIKAAFNQRRKTILNTLSSGLDIEKFVLLPILAKCGIAENKRAEELNIKQFACIANFLGDLL